MERKIISHRIGSILDDISRLSNALYAMDTTDIQRYPDNYEVLSTDAALRAEKIACRLRHLIYSSTTIRKGDYLTSAGIVHGIEVVYEDGVLEVTLPGLLPKRKQRQNTEFLLDPFYFSLEQYAKEHPMYRVYEGRIVQARVIAVAEKVVRVEVFGVETSILARDLAWDWIGDAHERFSVGDEVLVRILSVRRNSLEDLGIKADIKSISENTDRDNLQKCRIQGKYAGRVTDVHKGVVYVRLSNGVNAVAHSCYDYRMPGKKDDVSFAVTRLDMERGVAVGIITRIIRQNL